ncbi:hypothetical protein Tco_0464556 [Tanacetum coccineum]
MLEDNENKDSYVSNLDKPALLVTPLSDANEDECFDPGGDIDKINAFLDIDDGYHDLEGDIIYLESFLINDTIPNLPPKDAHIMKTSSRGFGSTITQLYPLHCLYMGTPIS